MLGRRGQNQETDTMGHSVEELLYFSDQYNQLPEELLLKYTLKLGVVVHALEAGRSL